MQLSCDRAFRFTALLKIERRLFPHLIYLFQITNVSRPYQQSNAEVSHRYYKVRIRLDKIAIRRINARGSRGNEFAPS
jgi:hypothetical protein